MQPTLFEVDEPDKFHFGSVPIIIRHPDHENLHMRKPFIFWDGEGYTDELGIHHYWLLANSLGDRVIAPRGRSLERSSIAKLFMRSRMQFPDAIHCGFALGYDFTCMLRSNGFENGSIENLYSKQYFTADGYVWRLLMGKMLAVIEDNNSSRKVTINDVWGFFQKSFVKALDEYFNKDWPYRDVIVKMKNMRAHFDREHDDEVIEYNNYELELGVMLMDELRDRLYTAGMPVREWYGPGAIASGLMNQWGIKKTLVDLYDKQPEVAEASRYAYAGGRFELIRPGHSNGRVFQYDINSAYPWAIAQLPNLARGRWVHYNNVSWKLVEQNEFAVVKCHVEYNPRLDDGYAESIAYPLWRRHKDGTISYPSNVAYGWYWTPELIAARDYLANCVDYCKPQITFEEAWVFEPFDNDKPFSSIPTLYRNRQKLKAMGNGAHVGIKLGLNSLYGKLAQQVGWAEGRALPPYHNLALAGWVTAMCRSKLLSAMALEPQAIIATETDAVFSTMALDLPVSNELGEWDATEYDDMWYFASGFRFGIKDDEVLKPATRGIPVKDINLEAILDQLKCETSRIEVMHEQFISIRWAMAMNRVEEAGQWKQTPKSMQLMCENKKGKRIHDPDCPYCSKWDDGIRTYSWENLHYTMPAWNTLGELNYPHKVAWVDSSPIDLTEREIDAAFLFDNGLE